MPETLTLPGLPSMVPLARRAVRALAGDSPRLRDIELVVDELAANAVLHSAAGQGGGFGLMVDTAPGWARIEVSDPGPAPAAAQRDAEGHDEYRQGLVIVAEFSDKWGQDKDADGRSVRWAEFRWAQKDGQDA